MAIEKKAKKKPRKRKASKFPKRSLELPKGTTIRKQPLTRDLLPPKYSAGPKIVYISCKTPFISAVKRVRKHFDVFDKQIRSSDLSKQQQRQKQKSKSKKPSYFKNNEKDGKENSSDGSSKEKVVILRGTGRAIEKVMSLGLYFQSQNDLEIQLRTGTVECMDKVVPSNLGKQGLEDLMKPEALEKLEERFKELAAGKEKDKSKETEKEDVDMTEEEVDDDGGEKMDVEGGREADWIDDDGGEEPLIDDEYPSRRRYTSMLEVIVRKKEI